MSASRKRRNLLRKVNDQIRSVTASFALQDATVLVVCECERLDCLERIQVPKIVYDKLREDRDRFVVFEGHEDPGVERITASSDGYVIVRDGRDGLRAPRLTAA
jgi:hypothetical protein